MLYPRVKQLLEMISLYRSFIPCFKLNLILLSKIAFANLLCVSNHVASLLVCFVVFLINHPVIYLFSFLVELLLYVSVSEI